MKELFLSASLLCSALFANAQSEATHTNAQTRDNASDFAPHCFVQAQAGAAYTVGEAKFGDLLSPTAAINAGYRFSPLWAVRAGFSGWESKGGWNDNKPELNYKFNYVSLNVDAMLNLSNLIWQGHHSPLSLDMFVGAGLNYAYNNDEAVKINQIRKYEYLWDNNQIAPVGRAGLMLGYNVSERVTLSLEGNVNLLTDKYNSKKGGNPDCRVNAMIGVTYNFKTKKRVVPVEEPVVPVVSQEEPVQVEKKVERPVVARVVEPITENVFFGLNSVEITAQEMSKIEALSEFLNKHAEYNVQITGYADAKTGRKAYNQKISEKRADAIATALSEKYGVAADRIKAGGKGDSEQPFEENEKNRVCICITIK